MTHRNAALVKLFRKQAGLCYLCSGPMTLKTGRNNTATFDHVIPKSRAEWWMGQAFNNKRAACASCNTKKGDTMPWDFASPTPSAVGAG